MPTRRLPRILPTGGRNRGDRIGDPSAADRSRTVIPPSVGGWCGDRLRRRSPRYPPTVLPSLAMDDTTQRPNVIPIGGFTFPAPPDWRVGDEARHQANIATSVLGPEDLTLRGRVRCMAVAKQTGIRCGNEVVRGSHVCRYHGAGGKPKHPDDPGHENHGGTVARTRRIEAVRTHLELTASAAVLAVQSILENEDAKPGDRLKAAEIVLDRTVGRHIQLEKEDLEERDLDEEIFALTEAIELTGTDDPGPTV